MCESLRVVQSATHVSNPIGSCLYNDAPEALKYGFIALGVQKPDEHRPFVLGCFVVPSINQALAMVEHKNQVILDPLHGVQLAVEVADIMDQELFKGHGHGSHGRGSKR